MNFVNISDWVQKGFSPRTLSRLIDDWDKIDQKTALSLIQAYLNEHRGDFPSFPDLDWESFLPPTTKSSLKPIAKKHRHTFFIRVLRVKREQKENCSPKLSDYLCLHYADESTLLMFPHFESRFIRDLSVCAAESDKPFPSGEDGGKWLKNAYPVWKFSGFHALKKYLSLDYRNKSQLQLLYETSLATPIPDGNMPDLVKLTDKSQEYELISLFRHCHFRRLLDLALMENNGDVYGLLKAHRYSYLRECIRLHEEYIDQATSIDSEQWRVWDSLYQKGYFDAVVDFMRQNHQQMPEFYRQARRLLHYGEKVALDEIPLWLQGLMLEDKRHILSILSNECP